MSTQSHTPEWGHFIDDPMFHCHPLFLAEWNFFVPIVPSGGLSKRLFVFML